MQLVLEKGFDFAVFLKSISILEITAAIEKGLKGVRNSDDVGSARSKVSQILSNMKLPLSNNSNSEFYVLQNLGRSNSIKILKLGKGNVTDAINATEYGNKLLKLA